MVHFCIPRLKKYGHTVDLGFPSDRFKIVQHVKDREIPVLILDHITAGADERMATDYFGLLRHRAKIIHQFLRVLAIDQGCE